MSTLPPDIAWSAREALAMAYCWSEFHRPEDRDDTPESYWIRITPRARMECRSVANKRMLLAVARGSAVPFSTDVSDETFTRLGREMGLKSPLRVGKILAAIQRVFYAEAKA